jgi:hypothetical protein
MIHRQEPFTPKQCPFPRYYGGKHSGRVEIMPTITERDNDGSIYRSKITPVFRTSTILGATPTRYKHLDRLHSTSVGVLLSIACSILITMTELFD